MNKLKTIINDLTGRDKEILRIASNALYFNDSSDYHGALWEIVIELTNCKIEKCNGELFKLLND